jgi:catechol 2,3-dioxygenase-like lactoylglutathione lyase family enzyme
VWVTGTDEHADAVTGHPGSLVRGLHHISLTVSDLDHSVGWYERVLGLDAIGENDHDGGRTVVLAEGTTGIVILLQQHKAHEGTASSEYRPGLDHLSFRVDGVADIEAWAEHLDGLGVDRRDILVEEWGAVLVFRDPDRIQLEIFCDP